MRFERGGGLMRFEGEGGLMRFERGRLIVAILSKAFFSSDEIQERRQNDRETRRRQTDFPRGRKERNIKAWSNRIRPH